MGNWTGHHGRGQPGWLDLWRVPEPQRPAARPLRVVRGPGAAMLQADRDFETGLLRVEALLRAVLRDDAPSLAFSLRPAQLPKQDDAPPLACVNGPSISVALAVGALWVLQDHLQPGHEALLDLLQDLAPERLVISAALGEVGVAEGFCWPTVNGVGGIGHKLPLFDLLDDADQDGGGPGLLKGMAASQAGMPGGVAEDAQPETLPTFLQGLATLAGSGLTSPAARALHHLLVRDDDDITDTMLIDSVRSQSSPATLKAWLVWRWAQRAGGTDAVFDKPARLARRFTRLTLSHDNQGSQGDGKPKDRDADPPAPYRLEELLDDPHFGPGGKHGGHAGWLIDAPPFAGKSTLLAWREMGTARRALQALRGAAPRTPGLPGLTGLPGADGRPVDHIEVCVVLPLREWKPAGVDARQLRQHFEAFLLDNAPLRRWWPSVSPAGGASPGAHLPPWLRYPLRLRLCLDGLNEFSATSAGLRLQALQALCDALALRQLQLLPPLFTVREREADLLPASPVHAGWRLAHAPCAALEPAGVRGLHRPGRPAG